MFPAGDRIPIKELDAKVVARYMADVREKAKEIFIQYKKLCKSSEVISCASDSPYCLCCSLPGCYITVV